MDSFCSFMFVMNVHSTRRQEEASCIDIIGVLPPEISTAILKLLDGPSLASAAAVNRRWSALCRGDGILRRRVRRQLHLEGRGVLRALQETARPVSRAAPSAAFARLDAQRSRQQESTLNAARPAPLLLQAPPPMSSRAREAFPVYGRRPGSIIQPPVRPQSSGALPSGPASTVMAHNNGAFPRRLQESKSSRPSKKPRLVSPPLSRRGVRF